MSRTDKDRPIRIQEGDGADGPYSLSFMAIFGPACRTGKIWGGAYARIGRRTRYYWKSERQRERIALARGREPEPARPRHREKWRYW